MSDQSQPKKTKWWLIVLLALLAAGVILAVGGYFFYQQNLQAVDINLTQTQNFTVKSGQGPATIATNLVDAGLIKNGPIFRLRLKQLEAEGDLRAGVFSLSPSQTPDEIIEILTTPPSQLSITLLPGWRREEFAQYLSEQGLVNFDADEFLAQTKDLEGQLWADTYFVFPTATTEDLVELLTSTFTKKVTQPLATEIAASDYDFNQILTIASILQRESKTKTEMQEIAAIINNRLDISMPLQFCATAQYASGYHPQEESWWVEPTLADTQIQSPYNTYTTAGLPPGPIAAPGINAIEAVLNPSQNDYLFYLHDSNGQIHYGKTVDEHNSNKNQYLR